MKTISAVISAASGLALSQNELPFSTYQELAQKFQTNPILM